MKVPVSWLNDFVAIQLPLEELAYLLTQAGLEVEEIRYVGLPRSTHAARRDFKLTGVSWEPDKIVTAAIYEVLPHPNADRLVLCKLDDGQQVHTVLTGAPNLLDYRGKGPLDPPLKVAYAREGASIVDAYSPGEQMTVLKRKTIRGVDSYSMVCSERELGISEEHEGIILLDSDAPVGVPLAEYMGDAVLNIALTPNIARDANILGVAREIAAITGQPLCSPRLGVQAAGPAILGRVSIQITQPEVNPRFVLGLIENVTIQPSPYQVQRRLKLAGIRPINNIVDATNYAMYELGEPLHAFDYDILRSRAGGSAPTIITRTAEQGEILRTLDGLERTLDPFTVLVCDTAGPLALAGVMGGLESEVTGSTVNVLLEGAAWNMINTRRTVMAQKLPSEASYRFSRGVHPAMAERGVVHGLELMRRWSGGVVAQGLVDEYPLPPAPVRVTITPAEVARWLGITLPVEEIAGLLRRLEFDLEISGDQITATTPDHRLDIGEGVVGKADLIEEIARIYGYQNIPETRMADALPPQQGNPALELEERVRDLLARAGLQEMITYRMTSPENEARRLPPGTADDGLPYLRLSNPISAERTVMRKSLAASVLEMVEQNARVAARQAVFEIGPVFHLLPGQELPAEPFYLVAALTGPRSLAGWQAGDLAPMDFYDLKGVVELLLDGLHIGVDAKNALRYEPGTHPGLHPGQSADVWVGQVCLGSFGVLHPLVAEQYDLPSHPVLLAEFGLQALAQVAQARYKTRPVPAYPPIFEDLAFVVDQSIPAARVEALIRQTGGPTLADVRLFDLYEGEKIGEGKRSLAYGLTYLLPERTLTDEEVSKIRQRIIRRLEQELSARLRS